MRYGMAGSNMSSFVVVPLYHPPAGQQGLGSNLDLNIIKTLSLLFALWPDRLVFGCCLNAL